MTLTGVEKILGNFSLSIKKLVVSEPGIYGLVGPNGSGKTTLARLAAGLLEPDQGRIDPEGLNPGDITFLSRKPYMMDETVYNNLVYPLKLRKIQPDPKLTAEYLAMMGFSEKGKQKARSLSGGEQQKLALLRALIFKPRLIIADEAMAAMDLDSLELFEGMILEAQKKDPIIWIFISHQIPQIKRLCGQVFFIDKGRIEAQGSADEIFSPGTNPRLRQYLRSYGSEEAVCT
ncbi:MAG: ABC transporter ATP-binding protein [Treponema sp.]|jgi:tungstate transport system ATP-binding protein|nr:ABC transporter ATP-binding protein [Treponema sp.]